MWKFMGHLVRSVAWIGMVLATCAVAALLVISLYQIAVDSGRLGALLEELRGSKPRGAAPARFQGNAEGDSAVPDLESSYYVGGPEPLHVCTIARVRDGQCELVVANKGKVTFELFYDHGVRVDPGETKVVYAHAVEQFGVVGGLEDVRIHDARGRYLGAMQLSTYHPALAPNGADPAPPTEPQP